MLAAGQRVGQGRCLVNDVRSSNGRIAIDAQDHMGETPVWSAKEQALYWINCEQPPRLRRWDSATGVIRDWPMPERIGGFALRENGNPIVCLGSGIHDFDLDSGTLSLIARSPFAQHVKLHESAIDRRGRLWIGAYDQSVGADNPWPGGGGFSRLDGDRLTPMVPHINIANMLAFSPSGETMYFCDSLRRIIWAADMDPDRGAILGMREFVHIPDNVCGDGAAIDVDGGYWVAIFGGGALHRYSPGGKLDHVEKLPFSQPTKPAFGGPDLRTLYVTSTRTDVPGFPHRGPNGAVYAFEPGVRGLAEELFAG